MLDRVSCIKKQLRDSIDSTPQRVSAFFKIQPGEYAAHDQFMGITVPTLRKIAKQLGIVSLETLQILIQSPINEERLLALILLTQQYAQATEPQKEKIYQFYRAHLAHVNNWNLVDSSAHWIMGAYLFDKDCTILETLAGSENLWERRIAIVSTWYFIRKSQLDWTFKLARLLQHDPHDLIHKAVGWMLREAGKKDEARLVSFLSAQGKHMPKTMLRYAMERLSEAQRMSVIRSRSGAPTQRGTNDQLLDEFGEKNG